MTVIRPARADDLDTLLDVVRTATRHMDAHGVHQWDDIYPSQATLKTDIEKQHMHLIEVEGRIAGMISLNAVQSPEYQLVNWHFSGRALVVHRLTIAPTHQRQGHATRLMKFAESVAEKEGFDTIRLDAFSENPGAVALYERLGYRRAGTVNFRKGAFFCLEKQVTRIRHDGSPKQAIEAVGDSGSPQPQG